MATLEKKFSYDDFASFEVIDSWWGYHYDFDSEGYTPIGAAVLNGAPLECIAYLMQLYTFDKSDITLSSHSEDDPYRDISEDKSKGKSPLEIACMVMNADTVKVLMSNYHIYQLKDEDGNPVPKMDCYGDPLVDFDKNGEISKEYFMYSSVPLYKEYTEEFYKYKSSEKLDMPDSYKYKRCEKTNRDILAAAILPKSDILELFVTGSSNTLSEVKDSSGNNPLALACLANCYDSVDHLLKCDDKSDIKALISNVSDDKVNAFAIADQSGDNVLADKLKKYFDGYIVFNDEPGQIVKGNQATRSFRLLIKPKSDVTVLISSNASDNLEISNSTLTFTPDDWCVGQDVTFEATDDDEYDSDIDVIITVEYKINNKTYTNNSLHFTLTDNNVPSVNT